MKLNQWFGNTNKSNIHIVTDSQQLAIAKLIQTHLTYTTCTIYNVDDSTPSLEAFERLNPHDYLVVALSFDCFIQKGMNKYFPTFRKPKNISCRYVFIRLDISKESLVQGLTTHDQLVRERIGYYESIKEDSSIMVTNAAGTKLSFKVNKFASFQHFIDEDHDFAFLPPSEVCGGIQLGSANGQIVVDLTIGQLYQKGRMLEAFGLVEKTCKLVITNSKITNIIGNDQLKDHLSSLEDNASILVELGIGLSKMTPTGIIGIDESIYDSCHFGIGDGSFYGIDNPSTIHLDVVIANPEIIIERPSK